MTSDTRESAPFFRRITIEGFRGFNTSREIDLDASAIIVWGANGRGKTSLADAFQWLLLGRLPRLDSLRFRQNEEHIVNAYAAVEGRKAAVSAQISGTGGPVTITRRGDYRQSSLEYKTEHETFVGSDAEAKLRVLVCGQDLETKEFERYVLSMALLQQDVIRAFLSDEKPDDRYALITRLLGLEIVEDFADELEKSAGALRERRDAIASSLNMSNNSLSTVSLRRQEIAARIETTEGYETPTEILQQLRDSGASLSVWAASRQAGLLADVSRVYADLQSLERDLIALGETYAYTVAPALTTPRDLSVIQEVQAERANQLTQLDASIERLEADLQVVEAELSRAIERSETVERLVASALPLLVTDICPVCGQSINPTEVADHLRSSLQDRTQLTTLSDRRISLESQLGGVRSERVRLEQEIERLEGERLLALRQEAETRQRVALRTAIVTRLSELQVAPSTEVSEPFPPERAISQREWISAALDEVRATQSSIQRANAKEQLTGFQTELSNVSRQIALLEAEVETKQSELATANAVLDSRNELVRLVRDAAADVVTDTFEELLPVVQDVFARLSPHPTFARLSLLNQVYRRRGTTMPAAYDEYDGHELSISPSIGFSSAQANVAALCYFVAFAFSGKEISFPLVFMDDPLQSMDDVNTLGFADLCRFLRHKKQMIISTHDDRLASLLLRKLTPRFEEAEILSIHFSAWDRSGPLIEPQRIEAERPPLLFSHNGHT